MRYNVTIAYKGKQVTVKIPCKALEGMHTLPNFLKKSRAIAEAELQTLHMLLDWPVNEILDYENGKRDIPQRYLQLYCYHLKLPQKIKSLGIIQEDENRKMLAATLKQIRTEREIPQVILSAELEIPRSTYACYETGKILPDVLTLWKIADHYGISLDELVGRKINPEAFYGK